MPFYTGDPLHSRAACTQPCNINTHSRAHCSPGARLCEQWGHGCVNNGARLCASARLCRGSPVFLINAARKVLNDRKKYNFAIITKPGTYVSISLFSASTVPNFRNQESFIFNLKVLPWKLAQGTTKMRKSVIRSVWAYLMSCKAHYRYHELGTRNEWYLQNWR